MVNAWQQTREERARRHAERRLRAHPWPQPLLTALGRLAGEHGRALVVGGAVRDILLGREVSGPVDVSTDRRPEEVRRCFARTEPIGERHGTVLVIEPGLSLEVTTFRREGEYEDARRPDAVWFTDDPVADLGRRDLTINAMAFDPRTGVLLDPHAGARDLESRRLRAVGDPEARFREDALRPLRVARFAAVLEFEVEELTRRALGIARDRSRRLAWERVRDEFERMMRAPRPSVGFEILREAGLLELWLPEVARCRGVPQNRHHAFDVYFHLLHSCDAARPEDPVVRWAALLHDIGKPDTRGEKQGEGTFHNHEIVGAAGCRILLDRLRFPSAFRDAVVHLVRHHMFDYRPQWSDAALRRWIARVGAEQVAPLFDLRIADSLGNGKRGFPAYLDAMAVRVDRILEQGAALSIADLAIDGNDVMRVTGLPPGPEVGRRLRDLLQVVLDDPTQNRADRLLEHLAIGREFEPPVA